MKKLVAYFLNSKFFKVRLCPAEPYPMELFVNNVDDNNKHVPPKLKVPRAERSVAVISKA